MIARAQWQAVDDKKHDAADDQHGGDQARAFEQDELDEVMRKHPDDSRWQECQQDGAGKAPRPRVRPQTGDGARNLRGIDTEDRQNRAKLDRHLEGLARAREPEEMPRKQEMSGGRDRNELRQPLEQSQDESGQRVVHCAALPIHVPACRALCAWRERRKPGRAQRAEARRALAESDVAGFVVGVTPEYADRSR